MRTTKHFTLVLEQDAAEKIKNLTRYFGGSVGGFASDFVTDVSNLNAQQIISVRDYINSMRAKETNQLKASQVA